MDWGFRDPAVLDKGCTEGRGGPMIPNKKSYIQCVMTKMGRNISTADSFYKTQTINYTNIHTISYFVTHFHEYGFLKLGNRCQV